MRSSIFGVMIGPSPNRLIVTDAGSAALAKNGIISESASKNCIAFIVFMAQRIIGVKRKIQWFKLAVYWYSIWSSRDVFISCN